MKLDQLIQHDLLTLPKSWSKEGYESYFLAVKDLGERYLSLLNELDEDQIRGTINYLGEVNKSSLLYGTQKVIDAITQTLNTYLEQGDPYMAYKKFDEYFKYDKDIEPSKQPVFYIQITPIYPYNYRLRYKKGAASKFDMFHVSFQERELIPSCRYSIPGFPSLYLSNSIYTAYKELNEPDYEHLYVSKFEFVKSKSLSNSLLDLTYKRHIDPLPQIYRYLASWPLIMACTIKVENIKANFKAEYVLPQIVFLWTKNNMSVGGKKLLGVKYTSTKFNTSSPGFHGHFYNTALHAQVFNKTGYCSNLEKLFLLSNPINFKNNVDRQLEVNIQGQVLSINLNGARVNYIDTDFGKLEEILSNDSRPSRTILNQESSEYRVGPTETPVNPSE